MNNKMHDKILKTIMLVSGMVGFATVDLSKKATLLPEEKFSDAISIEDTPKGFVISAAIIVDVDVRSKIISHEIHSSIKALMKENGFKIYKINIYIRGVK